MTLVTELDLPAFDYTDPALRGERFHATMAELRQRSWIACSPLGFFVLDREAGEEFLRTRKATFPGMKLAEIFGVTEGPLFEEISRNILNVGGDDHRRLRNLVNPAFAPKAANRYRPAMRGFLEGLFAPLQEVGHCDLVPAIAKSYPALVIATVMGAPITDAERLHDWSAWIQRQFSADLVGERERIERAVEEFYEYAGALLEQRRATPGEDLVSTLIAAEQEGDRLSDVELVNLVLNVLIGAIDTTQSQLTHALRLFAEHPDQWELLAQRPELAPAAVEEVLRFEPITPFTARILIEDFELRGVTFPAGTVVMVCAFTANREGEGEGLDRFDIAAQRPRARVLTFGAGIHYCLGANLARAELEEALAFLAPRMPGLELDGEPVFDSINGIYGMLELPIRWRT